MKRFVLLSLAVLCFAPAISVASVPNPDRTAVISALSTAPDAPPEIELQVQSPRAVPAVRSIRTAPAITAASSPITRALSAQKGSTAMPQDRILQFFAFAHLPPAMQSVSKPFHDLAHQIAEKVPSNPERTVALRKLLESKDAAVRAGIYKEPSAEPGFCDVCPHAVALHNPDGSCGCGLDCDALRKGQKA